MSEIQFIRQESIQILNGWIASCTRGNKVSRNTIAVGIVVLDHLRRKSPVSRHEVISQGGEIKGARSRLGAIFQVYGIPSTYLKEATTRQVHQDGQRLFEQFAWGNKFLGLTDEERDTILLELIGTLSKEVEKWFQR